MTCYDVGSNAMNGTDHIADPTMLFRWFRVLLH
jgi:hypothetical protein